MRECLMLVGMALVLGCGSGRQAAAPLAEPVPQPAPSAAPSPAPGAVALGSPSWTRQALVTISGLGGLRSLTWVPAADAGAGLLCVAGREGALWRDREGAVRRQIVFDPRTTWPVPVDVDADGQYEYADRGGGWQDVGLRDSSGAPLWTLESGWFSPTPDQLSVADLDGDGRPEFLVGFNAGAGLAVYTERGEVLWKADATNVFCIDAFDVDGDGSLEVVHSDRDGPSVRRADGTPVEHSLPDITSFCVTRWHDGSPALAFVHADDLQLLAPGGALLGSFPLGGHAYAEPALAWGQDAEGRPVLAAARTLKATAKRSELFVFAADGRQLSHEPVTASDVDVCAAPLGEGGAPLLLLAAGDVVWQLLPP